MSALNVVAAVVFLTGAANSLTNYATEELARMTREITSKHFKKSKCVALVTDHNNGIIDRLYPLEIPVLQVRLPFETNKESRMATSGLHGAAQENSPSKPLRAHMSKNDYRNLVTISGGRSSCNTDKQTDIRKNPLPFLSISVFVFFRLPSYYLVCLQYLTAWSEFLATDREVRVRFPALPDFLRSIGSGTGSTQPREYN
jgi:hypothetical protein